jgi:hypothetical protein
MLHYGEVCRERLRLKRYALMEMQRLWTGILTPYLDSLPPNTIAREVIEHDFQMLVDMLERDHWGCRC